MTGPEYAMAVGDLFAAVALAGSLIVSAHTQRRIESVRRQLEQSRRCPECGALKVVVHRIGCPVPVPREETPPT